MDVQTAPAQRVDSQPRNLGSTRNASASREADPRHVRSELDALRGRSTELRRRAHAPLSRPFRACSPVPPLALTAVEPGRDMLACAEKPDENTKGLPGASWLFYVEPLEGSLVD